LPLLSTSAIDFAWSTARWFAFEWCRVKLIADRFRIGGAGIGRASSPDAGPAQIGQKEIVERSLFMLWIIVLILVILAVGGGLAVNSLVWLLLVVALIVAAFALMSGRRV
jgi:hypothetical protein